MKNAKEFPLVSIILPMYNAEITIVECIDSILRQTYKNFEIIVIDDGSTDNSVSIVKAYKDERIKLYHYKHDYIGNLNKAFSLCSGRYIARMDADDKMLPTRIEKQLNILENNPNVSVCCSSMKIMGKNTVNNFMYNGIIPNLKIELLQGNFLLHPTIMMRKEVLSLGIKYRKNYIYAEDYKLWTELALKDVVFYNIAEPLVEYRLSNKQVSYIYREQQKMTAWLIRQDLLESLINNTSTPTQIKKLYRIMLDINKDGLISPLDFYQLFFCIFLALTEKQRLNRDL